MTVSTAVARPPSIAGDPPMPGPPTFDAVYQAELAFVWRSLRALGIDASAIDDAAQDVFVVVHRRLHEFEGRSSLRSWLFAIARGVASNYRRSARRRATQALEVEPAASGPGPHESAERAEALRVVSAILDRMPDDQRTAFALVELEGLPVPEVAEILAENLNTIYSRLRAARRVFERAARSYRRTP